MKRILAGAFSHSTRVLCIPGFRQGPIDRKAVMESSRLKKAGLKVTAPRLSFGFLGCAKDATAYAAQDLVI